MANFISRPASADDAVLINAREAMASAQTLKQVRQAQVIGLSLVGVGNGPNQGGTGQASGAQSGTGLSLQAVAPSQLERGPRSTSATPKAALWLSKSGKTTPRNPHPSPQRLGTRPTHQTGMFQDEARFGGISQVRHCWATKPILNKI